MSKLDDKELNGIAGGGGLSDFLQNDDADDSPDLTTPKDDSGGGGGTGIPPEGQGSSEGNRDFNLV